MELVNTNDMIFVFGSNMAGRHGAGAAKYALLNREARMGVYFGLTGRAFAIPTKDKNIVFTLSLPTIQRFVDRFIDQASNEYNALTFQVTCIGCGLAGLQHADIAPMFKRAPENCYFDTKWKPYLGDQFKYWGNG